MVATAGIIVRVTYTAASWPALCTVCPPVTNVPAQPVSLPLSALHSSEQSTTGCQLRLLLLYELVDDPHIAALLPINTLRNAALLAASTPLVAMVDVDLLVSAALAQHMADASR